MLTVELRQLTPRDFAALRDFYSGLTESVTATFQPFGTVVTDDALRQHLLAADSGSHLSFGLFDAVGSICGHSFILNVDSKSPIFGIGLAECAQGQGLGRRITERLLAEADSLGLVIVTLTVLKTNTRAWSLYESLGFERLGEETFKEENDSFYMERRLPVG